LFFLFPGNFMVVLNVVHAAQAGNGLAVSA